jgi:NADH ubiquinone oxidoreductase, 20 Kd subunit
MAILGTEGRGNDNLAEFLSSTGVELLWHPSLSLESPREVAHTIDQILRGERELTMLCVEGSIIHGPNGSGMMDTFEGRPKRDLIRELCNRAVYVLAMGTCAAFGGIPAAPPNPSESGGLQFDQAKPGGLLGADWLSRAGIPVLNLSGCPVDAGTMIKTMRWLLSGQPLELDAYHRPFMVGPCLADEVKKTCGTGERVGYGCYGCYAAKFPMPKSLFRQVDTCGGDKPFDHARRLTFTGYRAASSILAPQNALGSRPVGSGQLSDVARNQDTSA